MTTKQIAEAVGKEERTVRNWVKRLAEKMAAVAEKSSASSPMKPADYDLDETCAIIEAGLGKNAASLYRENARRATAPAPSSGGDLDAAFKAAVVALTAMVQGLDGRLSKVEEKIEERRALLPAPALEPRQRINMLVREYSAKTGESFSASWGGLYREFGYRTRSNPGVSARNRGMTTLDYIEAEGLLPELEAVALDWAQV